MKRMNHLSQGTSSKLLALLFITSLFSLSALAQEEKATNSVFAKGKEIASSDLEQAKEAAKPALAEEKKVDHSYKPLQVKLNEDGSKYVRFIMWHQIWATTNNLSDKDANLQTSFSIRRSRFLAYAQVSPKFLILTHFGLNSLNQDNLTALGSNGDAPQLFLHGAWGELKINENIYVGGGLHYWKGLTRLANQSTLNFMTLDQSRPFTAWHSLGITDQFARHLGMYVKGAPGKFEYRFAINSPMLNPLGAGKDYSEAFYVDAGARSPLTYTGASTLDENGQAKGNTIIEGYVKYNLFDKESTKLPYYVGTYMGSKKVLAIGTGFFMHPNGMYNTETLQHSSVRHFAVDAFLDMPVSSGAVNAYASIQKFNYGENYISRWAGTGTSLYGQLGYYLSGTKTMPYIAYSSSNFDGAVDPVTSLNVGMNYFINGHNAKITAEYHHIGKDYREASITPGGLDNLSALRLQLHIFL